MTDWASLGAGTVGGLLGVVGVVVAVGAERIVVEKARSP